MKFQDIPIEILTDSRLYYDRLPVVTSDFMACESINDISQPQPADKVVIILSTHLSRYTREIKNAVSNSKQVYIYTTLSEAAHLYELDFDHSLVNQWIGVENLGYFDTIKHRVKEWSGAQSVQIECLSEMQPICDSFYLANGFNSFFPDMMGKIDLTGCRYLAYCLDAFLDQCKVRGAMFSLGSTSDAIAQVLVNQKQR